MPCVLIALGLACWLYVDGDPVDLAGELRGVLGTDSIDDGRTQVDADIGGLISREDAALGVFDPALRDLLVVDIQRAVAALTQAAAVIGKLEAYG